MNRVNVSSSNIASVGYDEASSTLEIEFVGGGLYQYDDVSKEVYEEFLNADSKGKFFAQNIKGSYRYRKIG